MSKKLCLGCAEVEITPDKNGLFLAGSLDPYCRPAVATNDVKNG